MSKKIIQFIDGPNLNLLGSREPEIYGSMTLEDIHVMINDHIRKNKLDATAKFYQSNMEGEIVTCIQDSIKTCNGLIINGCGLTHTSVAILDALLAINIPKVEVHLSNLFQREDFRHHSYISKGVNGTICGFGTNSYLLAIEAMMKLV